MLEDNTVDKITIMIEFEIDKLDDLIEHGIEEKFKYLMIGKINGMLDVLRLFRWLQKMKYENG